MQYHAVLFDLDYTLGDATGGILTCFRHALFCMGYPDYPDDVLCRTIGYTLQDSFSQVTGEWAYEKREQFRTLYAQKADQIMAKALNLFPDALPLLQYLKKEDCSMAVVSTRPVARLHTMLTIAGIRDFFLALIGVDNIPYPKPDPYGILEGMRRCGATKERTLYIGDTLLDAEAAARAGVDFIGVATGTTPKEAFCKFPVCLQADHLGDVLVWLRNGNHA